jgi:hypothetical protein
MKKKTNIETTKAELWGFNFGIETVKDAEELSVEKPQNSHRRRSEVVSRRQSNIYRRAFSETQLLDILPKRMRKGQSYHCITAGDVDALSYLSY